MRKEIFDAWREEVESAVAQNFPEFHKLTKRVRGEPRGILKYQWHPSQDLWCYIAFRPLDSEGFDAMVGWSTSDRFPIADGAVGGGPQDLWDFDAPYAMTWSLNLVPRNGAAHWNFWDPPEEVVDDPAAFAREYAAHFLKVLMVEEARVLVRPAVERGIAEVRDYGIPYLRRRAAYRATV